MLFPCHKRERYRDKRGEKNPKINEEKRREMEGRKSTQ